MPRVSRRLLVCALMSLSLSGGLAASASAAEPPNQKDPCSKAGRDTCGTTGVGSYKTYKYGIRWFGDYRGAIPGVEGSAFCIDLRFWYPSTKFGYEKREITTLKNKDGDVVSAATLRRMNYAMWEYGRSTSKDRQAAVMLYVHNGMGDAAPGEVASNAIGGAVKGVYDDISSDAARYAGPYKVTADVADGLEVGRAAKVTVKVTAASGALVPGVKVQLSGKGVKGLAGTVDTGAKGTTTASFTPTSAKSGVAVSAQTEDLPAAEPNLYVPTKTDAVTSGQRLVTPKGTPVSTKASADAKVVAPQLSTAAAPTAILPGEATHDEVTMSSTPAGFKVRALAKLYGPAPTQAAIACTGQPVAQEAFTATTGKVNTPDFKPTAPGWYGYQIVIEDSGTVKGLTTPCAVPEESLRVQVQPAVRTQVSAASTAPGAQITDSVIVTGLGTLSTQVDVALYGPYATPDAIKCDTPPAATQTFTAGGDGTYVTEPVTLTTPGYYTYRETLPASDLVRPAETACAETSETTIVRGAPKVTTQISAATTKPGDQVTDKAVVTGLGALSAEVQVELWGPYASQADITCTGTPVYSGKFTAAGDGTYTTEPVTLPGAGYYTYREAIAESPAYAGVQTACGEAAETTITKAAPVVTTVVSDQLVTPGSMLSDTVKVAGIGTTPVDVEVRLYGPFASLSAMRCTGTPYAKSVLKADKDGEFKSEETKLNRSGFYTYVERIAGSELVAPAETTCGEDAETSFSIAGIPTGRGDAARYRAVKVAAAPKGTQPASVTVAGLGISAPVTPVGIDTDAGLLAIPKNIDRVGFWRDGAALGAKEGTVLLAGHVDSAKRGAGAFYALKSARKGQVVSVEGADGKARRFRITSVRKVLKAALPESVYDRKGTYRLVLVTCGGPFDAAKGSYRDNIIVTASPV